MPRNRDYSAEYQRRNELAKQRGFNSYGQQRRYTAYTGESARYVQAPKEPIYIPRYNFDDYSQGNDPHLDVFIRFARNRGMDEDRAYDIYMRRTGGRSVSRSRLRELEADVFDEDVEDTWY